MAKSKRPENYFWHDSEMHPQLVKYKSLWKGQGDDITMIAPQNVRDAVWAPLHEQLRKVVYCAARSVDKRLAKPHVVETAMMHMHHVVINNWKATRKKSYSYFYTCARSWLMEYMAGTGRGKMGGHVGKKTLKRKTLTVPRDMSREEMLELANKDDIWDWQYSGWIRRKKGDDPDSKRVSFYRYDKEFVELKQEHEEIPEEHDWSWSLLADSIDFQILSEYIPDTTASDYTKKIAYVLLDVVEMLVKHEVGKQLSVLLTYQMVRSKMNCTISNEQLYMAKDVLRQAFKFYAEDEM